MAKTICLFNHKGGVSKTTTAFHLGWMMASSGKKVLLIDADPQCNLTGLALGVNDYEKLFTLYNTKDNDDIYSSLAGIFALEDPRVDLEKGVRSLQLPGNKNLSLLPGHIHFSKFELTLATALTSSSGLPILKPLIGSFYKLIRNTASRGNFDLVLIDMGPSISATNMCLLMSSDYFIVPTSPDFFCYQSIDSLKEVFPDWYAHVAAFKDDLTLPRGYPKMLGIIMQNYRVYNTGKDTDMSKAYKQWSDRINEITNRKLVPVLREKNMIIPESLFVDVVKGHSPYNLATIRNFNSLLPVSQKLSKPMFDLTKEDGAWDGATWERTKTGRQQGEKTGVKYAIQDAREVYNKLAADVLKLI